MVNFEFFDLPKPDKTYFLIPVLYYQYKNPIFNNNKIK